MSSDFYSGMENIMYAVDLLEDGYWETRDICSNRYAAEKKANRYKELGEAYVRIVKQEVIYEYLEGAEYFG